MTPHTQRIERTARRECFQGGHKSHGPIVPLIKPTWIERIFGGLK